MGLCGAREDIDAFEKRKPLVSGVKGTPDPPALSIVTIHNRQFRLPIKFKALFQNFLLPNTGVQSFRRLRHIREGANQIWTDSPDAVTEVSFMVWFNSYRTGI